MLRLNFTAIVIILFACPMAAQCQDQPIPKAIAPTPAAKESPKAVPATTGGPTRAGVSRRREYTLAPALLGPNLVSIPNLGPVSINMAAAATGAAPAATNAPNNRVPIVQMGIVESNVVGATILQFAGQVERGGGARVSNEGANETGRPVAERATRTSGQVQLFPQAAPLNPLVLKSIGPEYAMPRELEFEPTDQSEARNYPRLGTPMLTGSLIPWGLERTPEGGASQGIATSPARLHSLQASLSISSALGGRLGYALSSQLNPNALLHPHFVDPQANDRRLENQANNPPIAPAPAPNPTRSQTNNSPTGSDPFGGATRAVPPPSAENADPRRAPAERGQRNENRPGGIITPNVNAPLLPSFAPVIDSTSRYYAPFRP